MYRGLVCYRNSKSYKQQIELLIAERQRHTPYSTHINYRWCSCISACTLTCQSYLHYLTVWLKLLKLLPEVLPNSSWICQNCRQGNRSYCCWKSSHNAETQQLASSAIGNSLWPCIEEWVRVHCSIRNWGLLVPVEWSWSTNSYLTFSPTKAGKHQTQDRHNSLLTVRLSGEKVEMSTYNLIVRLRQSISAYFSRNSNI